MQIDREECRRALSILLAEDQVFEIRALEAVFQEDADWRDPSVIAGFFDDPEAAVGELERLATAKGIYVTVNPVEEDLLAPKCNELDLSRQISGGLTKDGDILRRRWMIVDIDPERPSGVSATEEEHERAIAAGRTLAGRLEGAGWPAPVITSSGNGAYLLYRVDLPAETDLVARALEGLAAGAAKIGLQGVEIDTGVGSPSQMAALNGTEKRKGSQVDRLGRLYRLARILSVPELEDREVLSLELLEEAAPKKAPESTSGGRPEKPPQNTGAPRAPGARTGRFRISSRSGADRPGRRAGLCETRRHPHRLRGLPVPAGAHRRIAVGLRKGGWHEGVQVLSRKQLPAR